MLSDQKKSDMNDTKSINRQGEAVCLSDASSSSTRATSSPGRARRVSINIKKAFMEVKEMLSPHYHHQQQHGHHDSPVPTARRKSGSFGPCLDHVMDSREVPIHLHISHTCDFSISRKASSLSYSGSDVVHDELKSLTDVHHRHIQLKAEEQPQPVLRPQASALSSPIVLLHKLKHKYKQSNQNRRNRNVNSIPSHSQRWGFSEPQHYDDDAEWTPNPFLVDDP